MKSNWTKERIKEFSFLDTNKRGESLYDFRIVGDELEEAVFKRLIQIEGLKAEDIFNKKFDYRQIYKKLYSIIERNTKKIKKKEKSVDSEIPICYIN